MARTISFFVPSSFACICAPLGYRGLVNKMQPTDMMRLSKGCLGTGVHPAFTDSICHAVKSYFTGLFLNPPRPNGFSQSWCLLYLFAIDCPFDLLMGITFPEVFKIHVDEALSDMV